MIKILSDTTAFFDVDSTLVSWRPSYEEKVSKGIHIECPGPLAIVDGELKQSAPFIDVIVPHQVHIEQLLEHKIRGHVVVVWSAGGAAWASRVVEALGITHHIDVVMSKPKWVYDDQKPENYMPRSQWYEDDK